MNGTYEDIDDPFAGVDETAEFNPLDILMPHRIVERVLNPQPQRPPLPPVNLPPPGPGVSSGNLNTPAGNATIALPSSVVRQEEFRAIADKLETSLNQITSRLNTVSGDVGTLRTDFTRVEADTRTQITKLRTDTRNSLAKSKKDQGSQQMTNLMLTMMMQNQVQDEIADLNKHTHTIGGHTHTAPAAGATDTGTAQLTVSASSTSGDDKDRDNSFMLMLPLMMMQDGDSGSDNMMLPLMMMFAFKK